MTGAEYIFDNGCSFVADEVSFKIVRGRETYFDFPVSSAAVSGGAEDRDESVSFARADEKNGRAEFVWTARSPGLGEKQYVIRTSGDGLTYEMRRLSRGEVPAPRIDELKFFAGASGGKAANYFMSRYMLPISECSDRENETYGVGTDRDIEPGLLSPPPFVFPFENEFDDTRLGIGFAAPAGANLFMRVGVRFKKPDEMWFTVPYPPAADVREDTAFPTVFMCFGADAFDIVSRWAQRCRTEFSYPAKTDAPIPDWWREPIFCGWMEQYWRSVRTGVGIKDLSTQAEYERMLARMEKAGLRPGIIMIDDKWQSDYGPMTVDRSKWPDLRGFADECHRRGQKVLLWWRLWHSEGLCSDDCAKDYGISVSVDPCSESYRQKMKDAIRTLLSDADGCMDCDGFKLDYIYRFPDEKLCVHFRGGDPQGLELLREYYKFIYDAVKEVKPDALVNTSVAHPYFDDCFDQIRLHDYDSIQRETVTQMTRRANIVRAVYPDCLIDTDGGNARSGSSATLLRHNRAAVKIGSPALYTLTPLTDEELREIQSEWDKAKNGK